MSHSRLPPSGAHRWMRCPGWARKVSTLPPMPSGEAAIDGTHTHTLLEECLKKDVTLAKSFVGIPLTDHEGTFTPDEERCARVQVALDYLKSIRDAGLCSILPEEALDIGAYFGRDDLRGTADIQVATPEVYEIIDYKDGHTPVAPDSPQLKLYAFGGMMRYLNGNEIPFKTVRCTIIQPKVSTTPSSIDFTPDQILDWVQDEVIPAANATDDPNAPLVPGDHCKWCDASGNCEAQAGKALEVAQVIFQDVDKQMELAHQSAQVDVRELSDEKIRQILEAKPMFNEFLSSVENEAFRRFDTGHPIPGMKVVYSGRGHVNWKTDMDIEKALKGMKIPKSAIYKQSIITPAQAKKIKWTNSKGEELSLTERQIKKIDTDLTTKGTGNKMIVPESDSRQAINVDAKSLFASVSTEDEVPDWLK